MINKTVQLKLISTEREYEARKIGDRKKKKCGKEKKKKRMNDVNRKKV